MNRQQLVEQIQLKKNYLCIGLDTDVTKLPKELPANAKGVVAFNKAIIEATLDYCVSYKINTAFYEAMGIEGWQALKETLAVIPKTHLTIADAKRGDIGNTADQYAKTFFNVYPFDAVTVAPYMGADSVKPFLQYTSKWTIVLGLTSNEGSGDFQLVKLQEENHFLFEHVMQKVASWGSTDNLMFVVGATQVQQLKTIRQMLPDHFFLIPGVGAQGGSLQEVSDVALTPQGGILVNVSRAIIYADNSQNFAGAAAEVAKGYAKEMEACFNRIV